MDGVPNWFTELELAAEHHVAPDWFVEHPPIWREWAQVRMRVHNEVARQRAERAKQG